MRSKSEVQKPAARALWLFSTLIHTVLAKVSFSSVEEEEGDDGEATLRYYISREDRDYFNTLTQEICDSVVNSGGAQEEGEQVRTRRRLPPGPVVSVSAL